METLKEIPTLQQMLKAIPHLSDQEEQILEAHLRQARHQRTRSRQVLRQTFGLWSDRDDIPDSVDYVNTLRRSGSRRLRRFELDE